MSGTKPQDEEAFDAFVNEDLPLATPGQATRLARDIGVKTTRLNSEQAARIAARQARELEARERR